MSAEHHTHPKQMSHAWVASCETCEWLGSDQRDEEAARVDGRRHEADPEPKLVEWTPDRHPTPERKTPPA